MEIIARRAGLAAALLLASAATLSAQEGAAVEVMREYMEFSDYQAGVILPRQITQDIFENVTFIDTRSEERIAEGGVPGATPIEWREVLGRIDEIPEDGKVILYCDTGVLSAQAMFALRVAGRENVLVLQGGYANWLENAAYKP